jgi:hypothetical protein
MSKKEQYISIAGFIFSGFLFLCALINFTSGHIGAAIGSLGSGIFFLCLSLAVYKKSEESQQ